MLYIVTDPARPWLSVFSSADFGELIDALLAQDAPMLVCRSQDGASVPLVDDELTRLADELGDGCRVERATPTDTAVTPV